MDGDGGRLSVSARRALTLVCLVVPHAVWVALCAWAAHQARLWAEATELPPLAVRLAVYATNSYMRLLPFAMLVVIAAGPLLAWGIARAAGCFLDRSAADRRRSIVRWWLAAALVEGVPTAILWALWFVPGTRPEAGSVAHRLLLTTFIPSLLAFGWAAAVCFAISCGDALALHRDRVARGASSLSTRRLVTIACVLYYVGCGLVVPVPLVIAWLARRDAASSAEQPPALDAHAGQRMSSREAV